MSFSQGVGFKGRFPSRYANNGQCGITQSFTSLNDPPEHSTQYLRIAFMGVKCLVFFVMMELYIKIVLNSS